jgi:hypothetical protein
VKRNAILAARARRDAERYQRRYLADGDAEFARTIRRDVAAILAVADLIQAGRLDAAYRRAARLDTVIRDAFSNSVWNAMSKGAAFGHGEGSP